MRDLSDFPPVMAGIIALNVTIYVILMALGGDWDIPGGLLFRFGGLVPLDQLNGEYWRFLTAGFLHWGPIHLLTNAICLYAWGFPLEQLYGSSRLLVLYLGSLVSAAFGSVLLHALPFLSVGASGGASGLLGALLMLRLLGRIYLPNAFFLTNIGLNIGIAFLAPGIDWQAHLGGFIGGMVLAAGLRLSGRGP